MTPLTDAADQASVITPPPQPPAGNRKRSLADVLADPRIRLGAGTAALLVTAITLITSCITSLLPGEAASTFESATSYRPYHQLSERKPMTTAHHPEDDRQRCAGSHSLARPTGSGHLARADLASIKRSWL